MLGEETVRDSVKNYFLQNFAIIGHRKMLTFQHSLEKKG